MAVVLRSRKLTDAGFRHGFSTRLGGVSEGCFSSLNLARTSLDAPAAVEENYRRLAAEIGYEPSQLREVTQVHGRDVLVVSSGDEAKETRARSADALVSREAGLAVGVRTADCVPILVGDPRSGAVAAIHAGWRGVVARVLEPALEALGGEARTLVVAIGPHIRGASFEVSEDVAAQIAGASTPSVVLAGRARPHVDLALAVRAQLAALGVLDANVDDVLGDSFAESVRFHSHRRDAERSGRQLSAIVAR